MGAGCSKDSHKAVHEDAPGDFAPELPSPEAEPKAGSSLVPGFGHRPKGSPDWASGKSLRLLRSAHSGLEARARSSCKRYEGQRHFATAPRFCGGSRRLAPQLAEESGRGTDETSRVKSMLSVQFRRRRVFSRLCCWLLRLSEVSVGEELQGVQGADLAGGRPRAKSNSRRPSLEGPLPPDTRAKPSPDWASGKLCRPALLPGPNTLSFHFNHGVGRECQGEARIKKSR
eukprot:scaffold8536_cov248-Pinguiococcus_pyrenoidosus.AAC.2